MSLDSNARCARLNPFQIGSADTLTIDATASPKPLKTSAGSTGSQGVASDSTRCHHDAATLLPCGSVALNTRRCRARVIAT